MDKEENIVRKILKNEITWIISIVIAVYGLITTVILPINNLQNDVSNVKTITLEIKQSVKDGTDTDNKLDNRLTRLETLFNLK